MTGVRSTPPLGAGFSQRLNPGDETMRSKLSREIRTAVGNGRSPARKRKLNEKMLRSSEAAMPMAAAKAANINPE